MESSHEVAKRFVGRWLGHGLMLVAALAGVVGCGATSQSGQPQGNADAELRQRDVLQVEAAAGSDPMPKVSEIAIEVRDVSAVGRTVRFRGRATNHYDQPIDGVTYRLRLLSTEGNRVLGTEYKDIEGTIAAGDSRPFEMESQSMYFPTVPRFVIDAIPLRLGDGDFAPPADWSR